VILPEFPHVVVESGRIDRVERSRCCGKAKHDQNDQADQRRFTTIANPVRRSINGSGEGSYPRLVASSSRHRLRTGTNTTIKQLIPGCSWPLPAMESGQLTDPV
jgi:hypothetical protein